MTKAEVDVSFVNLYVSHWAKIPNANASHKEGMLNWYGKPWNPKHWFEKKTGSALYILSHCLCHSHSVTVSKACPVTDCGAPVVPWQEETSCAATVYNFETVSLCLPLPFLAQLVFNGDLGSTSVCIMHNLLQEFVVVAYRHGHTAAFNLILSRMST